MKKLLCMLGVAVAFSGFMLAKSQRDKDAGTGSAVEKLIGAWHLVSMEDSGADGKLSRITNRKGMLIYTRDGHVSVQLMLPESEAAVSNDYVKEGYEASFGSYDVNEEAHTITHHVEGSLFPEDLGKDFTRAFTIDGDRLTLGLTSKSPEGFDVTRTLVFRRSR